MPQELALRPACAAIRVVTGPRESCSIELFRTRLLSVVSISDCMEASYRLLSGIERRLDPIICRTSRTARIMVTSLVCGIPCGVDGAPPQSGYLAKRDGMAKKASPKDSQETQGGPKEFSEKDKSRARQWFEKAKDLRERRDYDYAIESYIQGLAFWADAVEEGHMPLWSLAIQRHQAGGKKPGAMERLKYSRSNKDPEQALFNAEHLLAKDPANPGYLDNMLKCASRAGLPGTLKWIAPKVFESMRKEKKPNLSRFKTFRQVLVEVAEQADQQDDAPMAAWCYEQAVNAVDFLVVRNPTDMTLKDEQRDLSGRLTIARGKYDEADSFRDSIQDADKQKLLHGRRTGQTGRADTRCVDRSRAEGI